MFSNINFYRHNWLGKIRVLFRALDTCKLSLELCYQFTLTFVMHESIFLHSQWYWAWFLLVWQIKIGFSLSSLYFFTLNLLEMLTFVLSLLAIAILHMSTPYIHHKHWPAPTSSIISTYILEKHNKLHLWNVITYIYIYCKVWSLNLFCDSVKTSEFFCLLETKLEKIICRL